MKKVVGFDSKYMLCWHGRESPYNKYSLIKNGGSGWAQFPECVELFVLVKARG
jgi:hypothetical protein